MAISVMNHVWNTASASGSRLLVLLALADHANELGYAWPKMETIAKYARIGERQVQRILDEFVHFGDLFMIAAHGRGHRSRYCLLLGIDHADVPTHLMSVFPDDYDAVATFCADHELAEPPRIPPVPPKPRRQKKATSGPPIGENPTSMTPLPVQNPTSMTPFDEEKPDIYDAFSQENPTSTTPFDERKGDIAMSIDPSCSDQNLVVVVDQQQSASKSIEPEPESEPTPDLVAYLKKRGMSAASEFADIPYAVGRADFDARRTAGEPITHIVNRWREQRPTAEEHYGLRPHQNDDGRDRTGLRDGPADRGAARPNDGGQLLRADRAGRSGSVGGADAGSSARSSASSTAAVQAPGRAESGPRTGGLTAADIARITAEATAELHEAQQRRC